MAGGSTGVTLEIVAAGAARFGIALGPKQLDQLARFVALLLDRNQRLNLTRIVEPAEVERRHLLDSLTCALPVLDALMHPAQETSDASQQPLPPALSPPLVGEGSVLRAAGGLAKGTTQHNSGGTGAGTTQRCIDVGSGGGLPGIPLAIAFPGFQVTLLESVGKKADFLRDAVAELGLSEVSVQTARAEDAARDSAERDAYDLVVARALAPLPVALELCLPFAKPGGVVVLPRGSELAGQLADGGAAAAQLAARLRPPIPLDDPDLPPGRSLVVADKLGPTPARFPRRPGMAAKRPSARSQESGVRSQAHRPPS
jgi:16S rRNA (guanine527-N7)-methyltransferase